MYPMRVAWTVEDSMIAVRAIKRDQTAILNGMVQADDTDAHAFYEHEVCKYIDAMYDSYLLTQEQAYGS